MGLDSVELLITIEKHFGITMSDGEAEKTFTVEDLANVVANHRPVVPTLRDIRSDVREVLLAFFLPDAQAVADETPIANILNGRAPAEVWDAWSSRNLRLPGLPPVDSGNRIKAGLFSMLPKWASGRSVLGLTFGQVLDAVVAHNHVTLIDPIHPRSHYEILMAVIGLSSDSLGIPELEIRPSDSFTKDLGVD